MAKTKHKTVVGCDEYGEEAWLVINRQKDSDNVEISISGGGGSVIYSKSQVSELIKELKKYVK